MSLYGSVHTHFESDKDTGNDLKKMVSTFLSKGAKKVAVTEHGCMTSYEDLKDVVHKINDEQKKNGEEPYDFSIIPGVEGYFSPSKEKSLLRLKNEEGQVQLRLKNEEEQGFLRLDNEEELEEEGEEETSFQHLVLIAKDYEGYVSLCRVVSESNQNIHKGKPVITEENLQRNIATGHVLCTSACIAGPFGRLFGLKEQKYKEKIEEKEPVILASHYYDYRQIVEEYEREKEYYSSRKPTKKDISARRKENPEEAEQMEALYNECTEHLDALKVPERKDAYEEALRQMKATKMAGSAAALERYKKAYEEEVSYRESGKTEEEAKRLLTTFQDIFGKENFYFELQNHGLPVEEEIYNQIIAFAFRNGHTNFVASNDVHIGVTKDDPEYEKFLFRRNVIQFSRFNKYRPMSEDDKEYTIKTDEELREWLLRIVKPVEYHGKTISPEQIVDRAIGNIEHSLAQCQVTFPEEKFYPKFCEDENAEFERRVREGFKERFPNGASKEYEERLEKELSIIKEMGYAGYHLIVADYLEYGRLLGYLPTQQEIDNAPLSVEELRDYIEKKGYTKFGYGIGPGRGSGAGSLCCYCLKITDLDPLPYGLLFERFLNTERVSMPDIDSDFSPTLRDKVYDYVAAKYGQDCVCKIMTKSYGDTKGNIRLAARYFGDKEYQEKVASGEFVPNPNLSKEEQFKEYMRQFWYPTADKLAKDYDANGGELPDESLLNEQEKLLARAAEDLSGVFTGYGQHAAGVIISKKTLQDVIPLAYNQKTKSFQTQCVMAQAENMGLLKMDFLGLKNLSIITNITTKPTLKKDIDDTLVNLEKRERMLKDKRIFERIFSTGLTQGIFQFESPGMKKMLKDFKPESFEDIILLVAAYRPGPMDYIPEIIAQKWYKRWNGETKEGYQKYAQFIRETFPLEKGYDAFYEENGSVKRTPPHSITLQIPALQEILQETYGVPIYQEQIMQIFQKVAGYSLGGADIVRRYMSKKKTEALEKEREVFIYGNEERGIPGAVKLHGITPEEANELFEQMMPFAKYGFNKSHAAAYALVAMYTAYCKLYHTADFFRYSLDATEKMDEIPPFVKELSEFGITLKGPSILDSDNLFTVEDNGKSLRFGLQKVKGFSEQHYYRASSIQEFIMRNPDVKEATLKDYARLGLFQGCWSGDVATGRVAGNRHEHLRFIEQHAGKLIKYRDMRDKLEQLRLEAATLQQQIMNVDSLEDPEESASLSKAVSKANSSIRDTNEKLSLLKAELRSANIQDLDSHPKESLQEKIENRSWEMQYLSLVFDVEESRKRIANCENKATFQALKAPCCTENGEEKALWVPCVVLSVSKEKKTKKNASYYEVQLMDRTGEVMGRRFDKPIEMLDGIFHLYREDFKYYTSKEEKDVRTLPGSLGGQKKFLASDATQEKKAQALANGRVDFHYVKGKLTPMYTVGEKEVQVETYEEKGEEERW